MSLAFLSQNFLGFLPSKFIYGYVYDSGVGHNSGAAMATIMFSPIIPVLAYYLVGYLIIRDDVLGYEERKGRKNFSSCCKIRCCGRLSFCCTSSVVLNKSVINLTMFLLFLANIAINIDHGILPAILTKL